MNFKLYIAGVLCLLANNTFAAVRATSGEITPTRKLIEVLRFLRTQKLYAVDTKVMNSQCATGELYTEIAQLINDGADLQEFVAQSVFASVESFFIWYLSILGDAASALGHSGEKAFKSKQDSIMDAVTRMLDQIGDINHVHDRYTAMDMCLRMQKFLVVFTGSSGYYELNLANDIFKLLVDNNADILYKKDMLGTIYFERIVKEGWLYMVRWAVEAQFDAIYANHPDILDKLITGFLGKIDNKYPNIRDMRCQDLYVLFKDLIERGARPTEKTIELAKRLVSRSENNEATQELLEMCVANIA